MTELKWLINLFLKITSIFILNCSAILKPNIFSNLEIVDSLERDSLFYISDKEFFKDNNSQLFEDNMKKYKNLKNENEVNLYAIYSAKNSHIEESEISFLYLIDKYNKDIYLLNYIRLKYLTEEFDSLREYLKLYINNNINNKSTLQKISTKLKENYRFEENTIYMGVLSSFPIFEKDASNELGEYFISIGDYSNAKVFYEKILNSYSYDIKALDYLLIISNSEENWQNSILYGNVLRKEGYKNKEFYQNLSKAYYENGDYLILINFLKGLSDEEKKDRMLLTYWRNSIFSNDISENVLYLNKFLTKNENDKRDIDLEFSLSEEGNSIYKRVFKGY